MKQKDILLLLISALILVIFWIGFSIYHKSVTSTIPESINTQIIPISPDFDNTTIEKIKNRKNIVPDYQQPQRRQVAPTDTPAPTEELLPVTPSPILLLLNTSLEEVKL